MKTLLVLFNVSCFLAFLLTKSEAFFYIMIIVDLIFLILYYLDYGFTPQKQ